MGLWTRILRRAPDEAQTVHAGSLENPATPISDALTQEVLSETATGVLITPAKALNVSGVYAAVRLISEDLGTLPLPVYRRDGRSRVREPDDPRSTLLNDSPNLEMTAPELREMTVAHAALWGKSYQYIVEDSRGQPIELWPLPPDRTEEIRLHDGSRGYLVTTDAGERRALSSRQVIRLTAFLGQSPVLRARQTLGLALAAEEYAGRLFANDARPGGIIQTRGQLDEQGLKDFTAAWNAGHQGLKRSHLVGILANAEWKDVGFPPEEAQLLETRMFEIQEIARWFRIPAAMLEADKGGSLTYSNVESDQLRYVVHSLRPWAVRYEKAVKARLFALAADRAVHRYPEFLFDALLRGDTKSRYEAHQIAINSGWRSRAEVREIENEEYVAGLDGFGTPAAGGAAMEAALISGARALAAQRWGLAASYGIVDSGEVRPELGFEGAGPETDE